MRTPLEEFKAQLGAWFSLEDMSPIDKVWRTPEQWSNRGLPEWVGAVLYIEEHDLFYVLNGYCNSMDHYNKFESLMQKCNVWWEMENNCVCWIYDPVVLSAWEKKEFKNG